MLAEVLGCAASLGLLAWSASVPASATACVGAVWLSLAPLCRAGRDEPLARAVIALASAAPFVALGAALDARDRGSGPAALACLVVVLAWTAALSSSAAGARRRGVESRWLLAWTLLLTAAPLVELALALAGEGARWPGVELASRLSVLRWTTRAMTGLDDPASAAFWTSLAAPTAAVLGAGALGWRGAAASEPRTHGSAHAD